MNLINNIKYWAQLFNLPIYAISKAIPRDKSVWLFGSTFGRRFADNPRYLYNYICQNSKELGIYPMWISHDKELVEFLNSRGCPACYYRSLKGVFYALKGGVYFYDNYSKDINYPLSGGALKINMWHGIPLKKIQHDNIHDSFRHPKNIIEKIKNYPRNISDEKPEDYVLTTSESLALTFASAFKTEHVLTSGYPRVDSINSSAIKCLLTPSEKAVKLKLRQMKTRLDNPKILLYAPTFRASEEDFFDVVDVDELNSFLKDNNYILVLKLHMKSKLNEAFSGIASDRILVIPPDDDISRFVIDSDLLITDYSSVYFDYLWLNKPIVFFDYDLDKYLSDSREMYYDYDEVTPGYKAKDMDELFEAINSSLESDVYKKERRALRDKVFDDDGRTACERLIEEVRNIMSS